MMKFIGKPYAGKPHVRFDEGAGKARAFPALLYWLNKPVFNHNGLKGFHKGAQRIMITLFISIFIVSSAAAQIKTAKNEMSLYNYSNAVTLLQNALKAKDLDTKREATLLLAECYRKQNDIPNAKIWYGKAVELGDTNPNSLYYYAQSLRSSGDYGEAKKMFLKYDSAVPKDPRGETYANYCDSALVWMRRIPHYEIQNVPHVNTPQSEFGAVFYNKGIIFASDRLLTKQEVKTYGWTGNSYLRLFFTELSPAGQNLKPGEPQPFQGLDGQSWHNGPASFTGDNSEIYFNRTLLKTDQGKKDDNLIKTHLLKIFTSSLVDGKWSQPDPFFLNSNAFSVGHPAISPDGKTLCFVSDMDGGYGGTDIYMCKREDGKWSELVNPGATINTFGNEMFPYIAENGDLYFASDGLAGFGGLDLFVTRKTLGKWTNPENLGQQINSSYDDFSLATADTCKSGFFSSNRPGGFGSDDIYLLTPIPPIPPPSPHFISGCVKDKTTLEPIPGATLFLLDISLRKVFVMKADQKGCFRTPIDKGKPYSIKATQTAYLPDCLSFMIDTMNRRNDLLVRDLLLDKLEMNKIFTLENIFYDFDRWNIRPDAKLSLNNLVRIMKENPVTIELGSHTDCRGSDEYNKVLSQKRAESAVLYIVTQGIDPTRITARGYGKSQLINRCNCSKGVECNETEHQANRRTEFRIVGLSDQKTNQPDETDHFKVGEIISIKSFDDGFFGECKFE